MDFLFFIFFVYCCLPFPLLAVLDSLSFSLFLLIFLSRFSFSLHQFYSPSTLSFCSCRYFFFLVLSSYFLHFPSLVQSISIPFPSIHPLTAHNHHPPHTSFSFPFLPFLFLVQSISLPFPSIHSLTAHHDTHITTTTTQTTTTTTTQNLT